MDCKKSRRGRPKGSGIDDSRLLREIAAMIIEDPELKPTTAIKTSGISDPSTIRRLRDKFKVEKDIIFGELNSQTQVEKQYDRLNSHSTPANISSSDLRTMALNHKREPARSEPAGKKTSEGTHKKSSGESDDDSRICGLHQRAQRDTLRRMLSDGLCASSVMWQLQMVVAAQAFQSPVVRSALRYQLSFSQTLFGFGGLRPAFGQNHN